MPEDETHCVSFAVLLTAMLSLNYSKLNSISDYLILSTEKFHLCVTKTVLLYIVCSSYKKI
jgi:hypothetical protein